MREIKFRGFDKITKQMANVTEMQSWDNTMNKPSSVYLNGVNLRNANDFILMQYIGLRDKNGIGIYDGDICLTNNICGYDGEEIGYVEVQYDNEECRYVISNNNFEIGFEDIYPSDIEVIGNICENPELLEQNNEND